MTPKIKTKPDLSLNSAKHQYAINNDVYRDWSKEKNVADHLKNKSIVEIKKYLKQTAFPFAVCFENWTGDYNIATGIRSANAFNAKEVFYLGNKKIDKRGTVGVHNYTDVKWIPTIDEFLKLKNKYTFVAIDNIDNAKPMKNYQWKENTMVIFGTESTGLTPTMLSYCDEIVYIEMFGSVKSLNCGVASGIVMNDIVSKLRKKKINI